jgi:hypothetical protein
MKEQASLKIMNPLRLTKVDGMPVGVEFVGIPSLSWATFSLPSGEHTLTFSYRAMQKTGDEHTTTTTVWSADDLTFTSTFESGKKYIAYWFIPNNGDLIGVMDQITGGRETGRVDIKSDGVKGAAVAYESEVSVGLGMDLVSTIGLQMGIQPVGFIFDMGKVALGARGDMAMSFGWAPKNEIPIGAILSGYGMLDFYINQNAGKAFGIGVGGGFAWDMMGLFDESHPNGSPFLRAEVSLRRNSRFNIYFDYYLKDMVDIPPQQYASFEDPVFTIDDWNTFGIGITMRLY